MYDVPILINQSKRGAYYISMRPSLSKDRKTRAGEWRKKKKRNMPSTRTAAALYRTVRCTNKGMKTTVKLKKKKKREESE